MTKAALKAAFVNLRRERDSNPRRCYPQRFSRPPHSTALPSLRRKYRFAVQTGKIHFSVYQFISGLILNLQLETNLNGIPTAGKIRIKHQQNWIRLYVAPTQ